MDTSRTLRFRQKIISRRRTFFNFKKHETKVSRTTRYGPSSNTTRETSPTREDVERYERDDMEETEKQ